MKNLFLALVGGKIGSNEKTLEIKCFSIISMNLNPKFQVQNQDFAFYPPRLLVDFYLVFIGCGLPYFGQYLSLMCNFDHTGTPIAADQAF